MDSGPASVQNSEWREYMGRDVRAQTIVKGAGEIGSMGSVVSCALSTYLIDSSAGEEGDQSGCPRGPPAERSECEQFQIGEGDAVPGLELALRHARVGETLRVRCNSRFCWGAAGVQAPPPAPEGSFLIPPDSDIEFVITILSHSIFYRPPHSDLDAADYQESAENEAYLETSLRKASGTRWYRYRDFTRAGRCYSKAAERAEKVLHAKLPAAPTPALPPTLPPDVSAQVAQHLAPSGPPPGEPVQLDQRWVQLMVASLNNLAATHLQTSQPLRAREACIKALEVSPENITTLLRAGRASLSLHEHAEALLCFQKVQRLDPANTAVLVDLAKLKKAVLKYKESRREMSKRMVSQIFNEGAKDSVGARGGDAHSRNGGDGKYQPRVQGGMDKPGEIVSETDISEDSKSNIGGPTNLVLLSGVVFVIGAAIACLYYHIYS